MTVPVTFQNFETVRVPRRTHFEGQQNDHDLHPVRAAVDEVPIEEVHGPAWTREPVLLDDTEQVLRRGGM